MLNFIQHPDFNKACKGLSVMVRDFERSRLKDQNGPPAFMDSSCIPHPEGVASTVYQCVSSMDLRRLNIVCIRDALQNNLRGDRWLNALRKLFTALEEMERLASGEEGY
jgi:hypothetical protein